MKKIVLMKKFIKKYSKTRKKGFVAIVGVIVVSAIGISVVAALMVIGMNIIQNSQVLDQGAQARYLADACAEYALNQIRLNNNYTGGDVVTLGSGECEVFAVIDDGGAVRTIQVEGRVDDVVRRVEVETSALSPYVELSYWREVAEF